tara:strand:- start:503 stop:970 length:468 start_codon:yes stop_codon:yes gene_type:complete
MSERKKTYKEKNGTTRVGDFLRSIGKGKVLDVVGSLATGNIKGAIDAISAKDNGMSDQEKEYALKVMELDVEEMKSVSARWDSDMKSDSWLSKNVRPLTLIFLTVTTVALIYLDSFDKSVSVPNEWIELLKSLLLGIYIAYFGSRGLEKYKTISK